MNPPDRLPFGLGWVRQACAALGAGLIGALWVPGTARAAPLDPLLSAAPTAPDDHWHGELLLAGDRINETLDILNLRSSDPRYAGTRIGDYRGQHLEARLSHAGWRVEGHLWQRHIQDRTDEHALQSWQVAGQWRLGDVDDTAHAALRLSAWGNQAGQLARSTNTRLSVDGLDTQVQSLSVRSPRDRQVQFDAIGSLTTGTHRWSGFVGLASSQVSNDAVTGRSTIGNCGYQLDFGNTHLTATPDNQCVDGLVVRIPNALLPYAAAPETHYRARMLHVGLSHTWRGDVFGTRIGWEHQWWRRPTIDPLISQRGGTPTTHNDVAIAELSARLTPHWQAVLRAQVMSHQFVGDTPMLYNTLTASRFGKAYGFVTLGVGAGF